MRESAVTKRSPLRARGGACRLWLPWLPKVFYLQCSSSDHRTACSSASAAPAAGPACTHTRTGYSVTHCCGFQEGAAFPGSQHRNNIVTNPSTAKLAAKLLTRGRVTCTKARGGCQVTIPHLPVRGCGFSTPTGGPPPLHPNKNTRDLSRLDE